MSLNLEEFLKQVKKEYGSDTIIDLDKNESYDNVIPVTSFSLAKATGISGFAKNKIYSIEGEPSTGKSTTAYDVIGHCQKKYKEQCLLIDKEGSYTKAYGEELGIDNKLLTVLSPKTQENMYDVINLALENHLYGCIVVDSLTSFAPQARFDGSVQMGIEAKVNSDKLRITNSNIQSSNCCVIFICQLRQTLGGYGDPNVINGGKAIPFYSSVRVRITRSEIDKELEQNVMKFTIIKNKLAVPYKVGTVIYKWGKGFDFDSEVLDLSVEFGIMKKEGNTYFDHNGEKIGTITKLKEYLIANPEYTKNVLKPLVNEKLETFNARNETIENPDISPEI
jgi:recombination protein RecA